MPIIADSISVDPTATISEFATIVGSSVRIGPHTTVDENVKIFCPDGIVLGPCSYVGAGTRVTCLRFSCPSGYLFMERDVDVGRGGCLHGPDSVVELGRGVILAAGVIVNPSSRITIDDEVGIGGQLWTHGAWPNILEGGPESFGPISIGARSWLPRNSTMLPGVSIGSDVVISMHTLVNRDIPAGCLAGGVPVKILKENIYPRKVNKIAILTRLATEYLRLATWKQLGSLNLYVEAPHNLRLDLPGNAGSYLFETELKEIISDYPMTPIAEDLRDFLRRHGIRFFTGLPFVSLPHPSVLEWRARADAVV